jgi:chromosome partitioning protein
LNSVFAADRVLVPISTDYLSIQGALQTERTLKALEQVLKKRIERRYLLTRFDGRRGMAWAIDKQLRERFGHDLCETRIAENVSLAESPFHSRSVFGHAPDSRGAQDYTALLDELQACGFLE